jgi:hypothetical protein
MILFDLTMKCIAMVLISSGVCSHFIFVFWKGNIDCPITKFCSSMGNLFSLHTWELNFGQTIRGEIEVLLGTSGGTIWELGEPFGNLKITD